MAPKRWWIGRDDGEICAGPYATREEAERVLRNIFDTSEYVVLPGRGSQPFYLGAT